jgi:hypothetical protein
MIDVLLLLTSDHPAVYPVKRLLHKLPKFNAATPLPYDKSSLTSRHKDNLNIVCNYLCNHDLPIPVNYSVTTMQRRSIIKSCETNLLPSMHYNHPFSCLKRLLTCFQLIILPTDKSKALVILPEFILQQELSIHISDSITYQVLSCEEYQQYKNYQLDTVNNAVVYYKSPNLLPKSPSPRYIYFLPKIHKDISEWRTILHPKMRPIVSDTGSITNRLATRLLPPLRYIEHQFETTVTSSLVVSYNLLTLNKYKLINSSTQIATIDVESLFTKIPQSELLQIVNERLNNYFPSIEDKIKFMQFLQSIIQYNTFQLQDKFCIQKQGLPMGGPLSGTLANIYLGHLETSIYAVPGLILYNRYVDDILVIGNFNESVLKQFVELLTSLYKLKVVSSHNSFGVNYLDMTVGISRQPCCFQTSPFSKKFPVYPVPPPRIVNYFFQLNIVKSQILRCWRISSHIDNFSKSVNDYLCFLNFTNCHKRIRRAIFQFLLPIKITTHKWNTTIPLCHSCKIISLQQNIIIVKIMKLGDKYISIKEPCNCQSLCIYILLKQGSLYSLLQVDSLHHYLANFSSNNNENVSILPIGKLSLDKLSNILRKYETITYANKSLPTKAQTIRPCRIYSIFKKPLDVYGIRTLPKKTLKFNSFFNQYKKVSRTRPALSNN